MILNGFTEKLLDKNYKKRQFSSNVFKGFRYDGDYYHGVVESYFKDLKLTNGGGFKCNFKLTVTFS